MKRHAPATTRNREAILAALRGALPGRGLVLEVASGTGEHAVFFAAALPAIVWQPSDPDADALASIAAFQAEAGLDNLRAPLRVDVHEPRWRGVEEAEAEAVAAIVCINMIHISPWSATLALLSGAGRLLAAGAPLITYGPYRFDGAFTAPSNAEFDASLRARDPAWGVRDVVAIAGAAAERGLRLESILPMPANNHALVLRAT
jgi:SAM-dependent methyltransferase